MGILWIIFKKIQELIEYRPMDHLSSISLVEMQRNKDVGMRHCKEIKMRK